MSHARYSKVTRRLWGDDTFRSLRAGPPSPRELWLYFLTCPEQCAVPGIFRAFEGGIAGALGWSVEALREAYLEVSAKGLARADWRAGVVVLPKAFHHNKPESPNHVKAWRVAWEEIPECKLKDQYFYELKLLVEPLGKGYRQAFMEALREPLAKPCPIQEQEQEQEQEQDLEDIQRDPFALSAPEAGQPKRSRKPRAKSLVPSDWGPAPTTVQALVQDGIAEEAVLACVPSFVDYWRGEGELKADWDATFRNRVRWQRDNGKLPAVRRAAETITRESLRCEDGVTRMHRVVVVDGKVVSKVREDEATA